MNTRAQQAMSSKLPEAVQKPITHGPGETGVPNKTFQPFGSLITIHVLRDMTTPSGLVLPDGRPAGSGVLETDRALVIACGPECKQVKEGDVVLIGQEMRVIAVVHKDNRTLAIREDHITGIVKTAEQFREMEAK